MMLALTIWQPHAQLCVIDGCDKPSREGRKHCSMHAEARGRQRLWRFEPT